MEHVISNNDDALVLRKTPEVWNVLRSFHIFVGMNSSFYLTDGHDVFFRKNALISEYTYFEGCCILHTMGFASYTHSSYCEMTVGRFCSIASNIKIMGMRHPIERVSSSGVTYDRAKPHYRAIYDDFGISKDVISDPDIQLFGDPPIIDHDVWIGDNVTLARGIRLHTGCVVATGSVVTKDVPPYAIVGGVPAKVIKYRFSEFGDSVREKLLNSRWWDLDPRVINFDLRSNPYVFLSRIEGKDLPKNDCKSYSSKDVLDRLIANGLYQPPE